MCYYLLLAAKVFFCKINIGNKHFMSNIICKTIFFESYLKMCY